MGVEPDLEGEGPEGGGGVTVGKELQGSKLDVDHPVVPGTPKAGGRHARLLR
jgi:hypothetical protein